MNSLYPSRMYYEPLPYGEGVYFKGGYQEDNLYNLYTQTLECNFELKPEHIPSIQIKGHNLSFIPTEYLSSSDGEDVTLCLTNIDLKLFFEQYEVTNITYIDGWKFKSTTGLFKDYIEKWNTIKMESTLNGNKAMRTLAKLMLNALYGKFALNPSVQSKEPFIFEGQVKYKRLPKETRNPIYIPVGTFITSYARYMTISSAQKVYHRFIYADTDSLHLVGTDIPDCLEVDSVEMGKWKHESTFKRARFIRQKSYIEDIYITEKELQGILEETPEKEIHVSKDRKSILNITCSGMPSRCYEYVSWDNFHAGLSVKGKLTQKHVKGGIVLVDTPFSLKRG